MEYLLIAAPYKVNRKVPCQETDLSSVEQNNISAKSYQIIRSFTIISTSCHNFPLGYQQRAKQRTSTIQADYYFRVSKYHFFFCGPLFGDCFATQVFQLPWRLKWSWFGELLRPDDMVNFSPGCYAYRAEILSQLHAQFQPGRKTEIFMRKFTRAQKTQQIHMLVLLFQRGLKKLLHGFLSPFRRAGNPSPV